MLEQLKNKVLQANLDLVRHELVLFTWGNVSERDERTGLIVIKPSGVEYGDMTAEDMVVVDIEGRVVEGRLRPSSDTPTHVELYKAFPEIGGVTHTHSTYATAWAQAGRSIPFYGTTHADYFYGDVPCARALTKEEIEGEYEKNTGLTVAEKFLDDCLNPLEIPGVLVKSHGAFCFGADSAQAVYHAAVLEEIAKMAFLTEQIRPDVARASEDMMDKHYVRKHGKHAYYGQRNR